MKKMFVLMLSCMIGIAAFAFNSGNVNETLLQSFKERFPHAEQVTWKESAETYEVYFMEDGVRSNIVYDKDGVFRNATRYYKERNLPYYLLINIKKKYAGKKVYGITEISTPAGIEYYIKMEDAKVVTTILVDADGSLSTYEKFRKAL